MTTEPEKIILPDSPEAARYLENIKGWVSRRGLFYGDLDDSEEMARWDGATHVRCKYCGHGTPKGGYTVCALCREGKAIERWNALPPKEWTGENPGDPPVYSEYFNNYFFSMDEVLDECDEHGIAAKDARLVVCEPQFPPTVDPEDHLREYMPDDGDGDIPSEILDAFAKLNEFLIDWKEPLSWVPGKNSVAMEGENA